MDSFDKGPENSKREPHRPPSFPSASTFHGSASSRAEVWPAEGGGKEHSEAFGVDVQRPKLAKVSLPPGKCPEVGLLEREPPAGTSRVRWCHGSATHGVRRIIIPYTSFLLLFSGAVPESDRDTQNNFPFDFFPSTRRPRVIQRGEGFIS